MQDRGPGRQDGGELLIGPLPVGRALHVEAVVRMAVGTQPYHGEADRLGGRHEPGEIDAGQLDVPPQPRGQRPGAQPGEQPDRDAEAAGGHRDVEGVAAGPGDVVRGRAVRPGAGRGVGQHVDDEFTEDAQHRAVAGHARDPSDRNASVPRRWLTRGRTWDDGGDDDRCGTPDG